MKFAKILFTFSFSIFLLLGLLPRALSQKTAPGLTTITYGIDEDANTSVPPPPIQRRPPRDRIVRTTQAQQFTVTYTGFTPEARAAFQYAVDIWAALIQSPVTIRINATFRDLGGVEDGTITLGLAGPDHRIVFIGGDVWLVGALADALAGRDVVPGDADLRATFNSNDEVGWYYGTDGNTPFGKDDFVTVVLHEIAHGLGFISLARVGETSDSVMEGRLRPTGDSDPYIYDTFVVNGSGTAITTFTDPSLALLQQLTGNSLYWDGEKGKAANDDTRPRLHVPSTWNQAGSYVHLSEITFPAGTPNSLMTPFFRRSEAIHHPGPIALGMFEDMGWTINQAPVFIATTTTREIAENTRAGVNIGSPVQAVDANNDTLTYTLRGTDAASFSIERTTGQLKTLAALNYETKSVYRVSVVAGDGRLEGTIQATINITDVNDAPTFATDSTTRSIGEGTPANQNIGAPISATDEDSADTLTYRLIGIDAASFSIESTTGQLKTKSSLNYETKNTYAVIVIATDSKNLTDIISVTINVIDTVVFADTGLATAVRSALRIASDAPIYADALAALTTLTASRRSITNLTGLEYATGLEELDLGDNEITDISLLHDLTFLETLDLADNQIEIISVLSGLSNLKSLDLDDNEIEDVSALSSLSNLDTLDLRNNDIGDVTPLSTLTDLRYLYLSGNENLRNLKRLVKLKEAGTRVDITLPIPVNIPDDNLAAALRPHVGVSTDDPIFPEDIETLTTFDASDQNIVTLTGLETATALTSLTLSNNEIVSLSPLTRLAGLETLDLSSNQITSVSSLSNLTSLITLNLSDNRISSVSSLSRLTGLETLNLSDNQITSVSSLSGLINLTSLDLSDNIRIKDVLPLQGLSSLRTLDLSGNDDLTQEKAEVLYKLDQGGTRITLPTGITLPAQADIVVFTNAALETVVRSALRISTGYPVLLNELTDLSSLTATRRQIDDLTGLEKAIGLTRLDLGDNTIVDLGPLRNLSNLETLDLADNEIVDLSPLSGLTNLESLDLDDNEIEDVSALSGLSTLRALDLRGNDVMDVAPLKDLTSLRNIYLSGNENITNLEWLGALENLRSDIRLPDVVRIPDTGLDSAVRTALRIAGNIVSNDLPMSEELLESLETLPASNRGISDLTGCEHMTRLTRLDLRNNRITDVTPLAKLTSLVTLRLAGNTILDTSSLVPLTRRNLMDVDIEISQYPSWDVNRDSDVDEADVFLITLTITGESPDVNGDGSVDADDETAADANKDGRVDTDDILLVFEKQDRPVNLAAPLLSARNVGLDWNLLERIDASQLRVQLQILRAESDGSLKYQQTIAYLQAVLIAIQPRQTLLLANYPNPFNPETWIPYQLARGSDVRVTIYDARGTVIRRLELGYRAEGYYRIPIRAAYWDGRNEVGERVASGIYFYQLETNNISLLRKMVILK